MSVITDTWRHLVRRRLWPLALLLVAALAAVPALLAEQPEPVAAPAPSPQGKGVKADAAAVGEPIVALAGTEDRSRRRRVLGARKNPFQPVPVPVPTPDAATAPDVTAPSHGGSTIDRKPTGGSTAPSGGYGSPYSPGVPSPSPYTPPSTPSEPQPPKKTYALYELTVRFDGERRSLERLEALPDADNPLLVYLGPGKGGRSAVFMVDAAVSTEGDATCRPDPLSCETIELREGDTQFLDGEGSEHQLDLVKIHRKKTTDAKKAAKARASESKAGRRALKARVARHGPLHYDYDRDTGTVRRLGRKAFRAKVATVTGQVAAGL